ncbi:MAG: cation:proton antiporter [Bryobacteraceae bacterium]
MLLTGSADAAHLPLALLLVFGAAKILAEICERLGQPGIVGEILAGVLIGPSVLNWVQPDQTLLALAQIGVMFLLFRVGLDVKASELVRVGPTALLVAILGVAIPFAIGCAIMTTVRASWIEAFFVGASLVATSVGVTAQVLASRGLLRERASQVILAAAVIDDVLGLLVLAFVSSLAEGRVNVAGLITTSVVAAGFTLLVAKYGTRTMGRVIPRIQNKLRAGETQFNLALIVLFGLSFLAVWLGVATIVGAFLAGMALSESVDRRVHDLAQGVTELLVPFFLAGIGLNLDVSVFRNRDTILLSLAVIVAAIFSKLIGCGMGAWSLGRMDMLRVGVGMVPRGEVGMVVAQIGLSLGVITKPLYAVVVLMTVVTTVVAPPMLKYAYRDCRPGFAEETFSLS